MLPHGRKDAKFDSKSKLYELNSLCELFNCNNCLFFEARKGQDLYLHCSSVPNGPTIKVRSSTPETSLADANYTFHLFPASYFLLLSFD